ncbi:MAG: phosphatidylserine decarboxylase [Alphaproteobacteria bacterium]|nr:phosphatidylserine decarboxylase [Alphaproteobacteria bacterium]MCB9695185.1 phosphatidylserine decarboxylase [Alphaproteobacteria bacterium]
MKDALIVSALSLVPRNHGARGVGWLARSRVSRGLTRIFVRAYGVDLAEAEGGIGDYPTLEALFTRKLRAGLRPVDADPDALVSPVDGRCAFAGTSEGGRIEVAPGQHLTLSSLLDRPVEGERDVIVLYLSPRDYHRVHVPREGRATRWHYVPGTLWPVFPAAVRRVPELFARNERAVVVIETSAGPLDVVLVGAFGVGRITLSVCDLVTNAGGSTASGTLDAPLARGDELGVFHLGSTVVLVAGAGTLSPNVGPGEVVRVGRRIAGIGGA